MTEHSTTENEITAADGTAQTAVLPHPATEAVPMVAAPMTVRPSKLATPRSRGMVTGVGLVLLGAWGAIVPFVGTYFHTTYTPTKAWTWTAGRGVLEVLPGAVTLLAGLVLLLTANRLIASMAGWAAVAAGGWFVVGPLVAPIWNATWVGTPTGSTSRVALDQIVVFHGLGAAIVLLAAAALGRFSVLGAGDPAFTAAPAGTAPVGAAGSTSRPRTGRRLWLHRRPVTH